MKHQPEIAVIGAGPSGITATKNFLDLGFSVTGFDRCQGVGGNWRFNDPTGHSSVFETTHIISSKYTSQYEDFPLPDGTADYPSHQVLCKYFNDYANEFGVTQHYRFGTDVLNCESLADDRWSVTWRHVGQETTTTDTFDVLVVCNGHHHQPRMPNYPGEFTGQLIHAHDFKSALPFQGKRVLAIGGGNSACDVAVETARVSAKTVISWRRGYHLFPKFMFGQPSDTFFYQFRWVPKWLQIKLLTFVLWMLQGRNRDIGLPDPDHQILASHPTVNSELYYAIRHGQVHPKGEIAEFKGKEVIFIDGSKEEFDVVIACTGYYISHPFLKASELDFSTGPVPLYYKMIPENRKNLYFIGLFQPLGCIWPGAELQAKLAALHVAGLWEPDGDLGTLIRELDNPDYEQLSTPRHTITVNDHKFRRRLRKELKRARKPAELLNVV